MNTKKVHDENTTKISGEDRIRPCSRAALLHSPPPASGPGSNKAVLKKTSS